LKRTWAIARYAPTKSSSRRRSAGSARYCPPSFATAGLFGDILVVQGDTADELTKALRTSIEAGQTAPINSALHSGLISAPNASANIRWYARVQPEENFYSQHARVSQSDMRFAVRRAVIGDESVLRALRLQALTDSPRAFSSTYELELARTTADWGRWMAPGVTFLLEADGESRGIVAGVRDPQDSSVVHLMAMWVHPDVRGTGAADRLVTSVKTWAAEVGATQVHLKVVQSNSRARGCYERAGFRATGRQSVLERTGDVEVEMICDSPVVTTDASTRPGKAAG
jgi:GNAT superfamily N-acetyltransferase